MKRFLAVALILCAFVAVFSFAHARCMRAWLEIWDSGGPLEGYDTATMYINAPTCDNGIHNTFAARVVLTNSDGSTVMKTSALYTNATGTKNSGKATANNRSASKAVGYAKGLCYICGGGWGGGSSFVWVPTKVFTR